MSRVGVHVQYTRFTNLDDQLVEGSSLYGYRIYDDETSDYNSTFSTAERLGQTVTSDNIFEFIKESHPDFYDVVVMDGGIYLNDEWVPLTK